MVKTVFLSVFLIFLAGELSAQTVYDPRPVKRYDLLSDGSYSEPYFLVGQNEATPNCDKGCRIVIGVKEGNTKQYWSPIDESSCEYGIAEKKYFVHPQTGQYALFKRCADYVQREYRYGDH